MFPSRRMQLFLTALAVLFLPAIVSFAGTGGTELNSLYAEIAGWVTGAPGKILAAALFVCAVYCVCCCSYTMAIVAFVLTVTLTIIPNIVNTRFTGLF